jgi:ribosomal protein L29
MNDVHEELIEAEAEITRLKCELAQVRDEAQATMLQCAHTINELRTDAAKVINTLDCAMQTVDALLAWMPQGLSLSPEVSACKERLDAAMRTVMGGHRR